MKSKVTTARGYRKKGKGFEREIAALYRHHGIDETAQPMPMSGGMAWHKGDILKKHDHEFVDECKKVEKLNIWQCWAQAALQAKGLEIPLLHISRNLHEPLTVMRTDTYFQLRLEILQLREELNNIRSSYVRK